MFELLSVLKGIEWQHNFGNKYERLVVLDMQGGQDHSYETVQ